MLSRRNALRAAVAVVAGGAAVVAAPVRAVAAVAYDTTRGLFVNGNMGIGTAPWDDDRLRLHMYSPTGLVAMTAKTGGDSNDVNIDGAVFVKHHKAYGDTPGYSDTLQVYTPAGSAGTIVGSNDFAELDRTKPYAIPANPTPTGWVRVEIGPSWPRSEVARFTSDGALVLDWRTEQTVGAASQSQEQVYAASAPFTADDVGRYVCWGDRALRGRVAHADRITGYISPTRVAVERSRTIETQAMRVCTPRALVRKGVLHLLEGAPGDVAPGTVALFVEGGALKARTAGGAVTVLAT